VAGAIAPVALAPLAAVASPVETPASSQVDFGDTLTRALSDAGGAERAADDAAQKFAAGDPQMGLHEVMIASEKANIAVRYAVTLKNRLVEAYKELMSTQV
jgi:flagellar hook-basal body complex protein FliE